MNREQRRQQMSRKGIIAGPLQEKKQCAIDYGHNGHQVMRIFTAKIENLVLTEQQVEGMIEGLNTAKAALIAHKAAAEREGGPGHG